MTRLFLGQYIAASSETTSSSSFNYIVMFFLSKDGVDCCWPVRHGNARTGALWLLSRKECKTHQVSSRWIFIEYFTCNFNPLTKTFLSLCVCPFSYFLVVGAHSNPSANLFVASLAGHIVSFGQKFFDSLIHSTAHFRASLPNQIFWLAVPNSGSWTDTGKEQRLPTT